MIRINQVKVKPGHTQEQLYKKAAALLKTGWQEIEALKIIKESVDARKKPEIVFSYVLDVKLKNIQEKAETAFVARLKNPQVSAVQPQGYCFHAEGTKELRERPVIIGAGPGGLFCAYYLAKYGYRPILVERGKDVDARQKDVESFWETGRLNPQSNVQFGEGGAGTFSDGKLNTLVKDREGRNGEVLRLFAEFGAPDRILYEAKPHIGTDILCRVIKNLREEIIRLGGEVCFESEVTDILPEDGHMSAVVLNGNRTLPCRVAVCAIGHSARDTFAMLYDRQVPMEAKAFAVGFRVEHPQYMINESQYGMAQPPYLPAAAYKVAAQTSTGRGVYSFCMCPGGYVVNASSEEGRLAVNGMSYSSRDGSNANSAVIVSVTPEDFGTEHPLQGIAFQRRLEEKAYLLGNGSVPVQRYGDFRSRVSALDGKEPAEQEEDGAYGPCIKGAWCYADLTTILPEECNRAFVEGMEQFDRSIHGFAMPQTLLSGIESRTSSPVRILRDDTMQSAVRGLYPCGEGAGYAGGITSAAMDGMRIAESIAAEYRPFDVPLTKE